MASNTHQKNVIPTAIHGTPGLSMLLLTSLMRRNGSTISSWRMAHTPTTSIWTSPSSEIVKRIRKRNTPPQKVKVARARSHQVTSTRPTNARRLARTTIVGTLRTLVQ